MMRLLLAIAGALQLSCTQIVIGHIPPSTFQFTNVVPYTGPREGGWKVAQVLVLLGKLSPVFPAAATCEIEVGVPEVNRYGPVPDDFAQAAAAKAADEAARIVMREQQPTALACTQFRKHMQHILGDRNLGSVPGARVTGFLAEGVPRVTFP
ncbi:hypothetical protein F0U61_36695 [Archangium violaceum]|uniref:hypothetical protein n=1 Tax=Archangium violaceum TaxID=83451 RepID=UPI002B3040D7|nr:hypothetical protein F0U61_36695 [Archangium violaceum]